MLCIHLVEDGVKVYRLTARNAGETDGHTKGKSPSALVLGLEPC